MKTIKIANMVLLCLMLIFAFASCETNIPGAPDDHAGEQAEVTENADDYDISSNLTISGGKDEKTIDTDHFTITLTHGDSWDYEAESNSSITIYNIASREANCGGRLVSIIAFDTEDKEYKNLPSYGVIGERDGKMYIAEYPSDVQFDVENEQATADYEAVYEEVNKIRKGSKESPIVLK